MDEFKLATLLRWEKMNNFLSLELEEVDLILTSLPTHLGIQGEGFPEQLARENF